jgi:serine/threonine protein kinase
MKPWARRWDAYKLLERVGEGGCGVVYVAEQTEPVRRHVALKVIKLGMDTKQVVARFEAERQALAMGMPQFGQRAGDTSVFIVPAS